MDNPDSTVEHNMFQRGYYFAPRPKRPREDERHASAFAEVYPQKSITWRSPLVHSPAEKFSPLRFNFVNNMSENIDIPLGAEDTTTSISSPNLSPFETSEKPSSSKSLKKKPKYQFPLSDREYAASEVNNESVSKRLDELDAICDFEEFGFVVRKKESAKNPSASSKPRVAVGKYYSELLMNSQNKSQQNEPKSNLPKNAISTQSSEKKSAENEQQQQSQELFTQNDNVSSDAVTKIYQDTKLFTQPVPVEYHQYNHDFPRRNHVDHIHTCDALNASFVEPSHYNFSELTQRRYVNRYRDEHRSNPYFGHHQPTRSQYSHMCCSRNPTRYPNAADLYHNPYLETIPEAAPCCDFAVNRCLPSRAYYDIPEDHCRRPIDHHQPLRFMENRDINRYSTSYFENAQSPVNNRSVLNFEKENLPSFYTEAPNSQTSRLNLREIYAATPKRHLVHAAPAFQRKVHPSTSDQRRMSNFHSFEERLNNSIIPGSLSSYASEDHRLRQRGNEERDYVMNSFMFANNQNRTQ